MEKFKLPIKLQEDKEYSSYLVYILNQYIIYAEKLGVEIEVLENVKENVKLIIDCIEYYYSGQVSEAKKI